MTNTEKPATKAQTKKQGLVKTPKKNLKPETSKQIVEDIKKSRVSEKQAITEEKLDEKEQKPIKREKKEETVEKKPVTKKKIKKDFSVVNAKNIPVSTKQCISICRFVKRKRIGDAIRDLEKVSQLKKAVPMKGEIPHRKGKMSSGRYPQKAAKHFIIVLKSLAGNSSEMNDPIITEAIANFGSRPLGRFGRIKKKRTNIKLVAREIKTKKKSNKKIKKKINKEEKK